MKVNNSTSYAYRWKGLDGLFQKGEIRNANGGNTYG